jgi:transposase-like protein
MRPTRADGMLTTTQAAAYLGVKPHLIRKWRQRGWLPTQGLDERGYPLHTPQALRAAESLVTGHGITATGVNPRQLRGRTRRQEEAAA